jgi:pyridoxamine 5'-phosphate oxidase
VRDPIELFREWFDAARAGDLELPEAMTLATVDAEGRPSARTVLLKSVDERGFVFFTNYESRKGRELAENPSAALVFHWAQEPRRQVLVTGTVEQISETESDAYYATRPVGSRLAAWASRQSRAISGREELERAYAQAERAHGEDRVLGEPPEPPPRAPSLHARVKGRVGGRSACPLIRAALSGQHKLTEPGKEECGAHVHPRAAVRRHAGQNARGRKALPLIDRRTVS